ncbi:Gldg family protein [Aliikangiella coralliicola]|nr:Gldg family protein [Aliikangiella coralliicola]
MHGLTKFFIQFVWRRPSFIIGLIITLIGIGLFARLAYQQFLYLQGQSLSGLFVFNEIILPLAGLTIIFQIMLNVLSGVLIVPTFRSNQQFSLFQQASIQPNQLLWALYKTTQGFASLPLLYFVGIVLLLSIHSPLDISRFGTTLLGMILIQLVIGWLILAICIIARGVLIAIIISAVFISLLIGLEVSLKYFFPELLWHGVFLSFFKLREGSLVLGGLATYSGMFILAGGLCSLLISNHLAATKKLPKLLCLVGMVIVLASGFIPGQLDVSQDKRNSLSENLIEKLNSDANSLNVFAVVDEESSREEIVRGFEIIRQFIPDSQLSFKSRQALAPELQRAGEYVQFQLGELQQSVAYPFEQEVKLVFESAIRQMLIRKQQWITFVEGHGEASPLGKKSSDLGIFYQTLKDMGWPVAVQSLSSMPVISDNTQLLVVASSKQQWLKSETELVVSYLRQGGSLLLLLDPDSIIPAAIEEYIGISRFPGTLVDWSGYQSGTPHPAIVIVNQTSQHPIMNQVKSLLAFPWSSGLKATENLSDGVTIEPIVTSHKGVWTEFDIEASELSFDKDQGELQQVFALAMTHYNVKSQQKIIMVGDSHFVSDSAINNYANKQFALNLVSWLTNTKITQDTMNLSLDTSIEPSRWGHFMMNWVFCAIFPAVVLIGWWLGFAARNRSGLRANNVE